jgi:hypothetical protein
VLVNSSPDAVSVAINAPSEPANVTSFLAWTSSNNSYWQASIVPVAAAQANVVVPGYGVVTLYAAPGAVTPLLSNPLKQSPGALSFSVSTQMGVSYAVEWADSPTGATWRGLQSLQGTGSEIMVRVDTAATEARYYRIRVE